MPAIIFFGCVLLMASSAWARFEEDTWQPASQLHPNPPRSFHGHSPLFLAPKSLGTFDAWFQQQRAQHRLQHDHIRQEYLEHELNQRNRLRTYDRLNWGPLQRD